VIPGSNTLAMFIGGLGAEIARRIWPALAARFVTPVASGFIAGESLMGVVIVMAKVQGWLAM